MEMSGPKSKNRDLPEGTHLRSSEVTSKMTQELQTKAEEEFTA